MANSIQLSAGNKNITVVSDGAIHKVHSMSRETTSYLIDDSEFDALEDIATTSKICWSAISISASMILCAIWDMGLSGETGSTFGWTWCLFWGVVAAANGVILYWRRNRRDRYIDRIKRESFPPGSRG
jgi:hypothetical protein